MRTKQKLTGLCLIFFASIVSTTQQANATALQLTKKWYHSATLQSSLGEYTNTDTVSSLSTIDGFVKSDYLDNASILFKYGHTQLNKKQPSSHTQQDKLAAALFLRQYTDAIPGRLSERGYFYQLDGDENSANIVSAEIAFLDRMQRYYFDISHTRSDYRRPTSDEEYLNVSQTVVSAEFKPGDSSHWIALQYYLISLDNEVDFLAQSRFESYKIEWSYFVDATQRFFPHTIKISSTFGERVYAVDNRSFTVYSLSDVNKISYTGHWRGGQRCATSTWKRGPVASTLSSSAALASPISA